MEYKRAQAEILDRWEDVLRAVTSPAKQKVNGHTSYICPFCGHGENGDGITKNPKSKDRKTIKCFGCNFSGDIFSLIGQLEGISFFPDQVRRAGDLIGISIDENREETEPRREPAPIKESPKTEKREEKKENRNEYKMELKEREDKKGYLKECMDRLNQTGYLMERGISESTAKKYSLGFDPHFSDNTGGKIWEALIIPTEGESYIARNTDPNAQKKERYRKVGEAKPFNARALRSSDKPIFITEGELDALSIIEAGGEAIGLGSTENIDRFLENYIKPQKPAQPLIIALDNDEKGEEATTKLVEGLEKQGISFYRHSPAGRYKDPNNALTEAREAFTKEVQRIEKEAIRLDEEEREERAREYRETSSKGYIQGFIKGIAKSVNTPAQTTGFKGLDALLDGGLYEGLYVLGAVTSLGKTTLALQIIDQIAQSGKDVLIFSLEMARAELMSKSISRHTLIDIFDNGGDIANAKTNRGITAGERYKNYSQAERDLIKRSINNYAEYAEHIYIQEGIGNIGVEEIRKAIEKHYLSTGNIPVVLVDYIQILAPNDVRASDKQNTDKAVLELKRISRDFKTPVIGISSFNRESYKAGSKNNGEVGLSDFKESGAIEYGSDVIIGLQLEGAGESDFDAKEEKKKSPRRIELVILKNRNGKAPAKMTFNYYLLFNYFEEATAKEPKKKRKVV